MKNETHYRQGDVLIERVAELPKGLKQQPKGEQIILALGEATGHHHSVEVEEPDRADWWKSEDGSAQFLDLAAPARVTHQEHAAIELPAGRYRVTRQREYSPEEVRNVAD